MSLTDLSLTPGDGTITVSWKISSKTGNAIIAKCSPTDGNWRTAPAVELAPTATSCEFSGLTNSQRYYFQVSQVPFPPNPVNGSATPAIPSVTVNAAPTGPPTPAGGWKVVVADGFNSRYPLSGLWAPAPDRRGMDGSVVVPPNANEVAAYASSQVVIKPDGLHLPAIYEKGVGGPGKDYLSGIVISQDYVPGEPGQQGFAPVGFRFLPTPGVVWVLEATITMPDFSDPGQNPNWSFYTPSWLGEIDGPEMWPYGNKPYGYGLTWINNTSTGEMTQRTAYGDPIMTDGKPHKWTHEINGKTLRFEEYIDGVHRPDLSFPWPASFAQVPLYEVFAHAMRNVDGTPPTFTEGSKEMIVHDHGAYVNGANPVYTGGLVAPGTVVR